MGDKHASEIYSRDLQIRQLIEAGRVAGVRSPALERPDTRQDNFADLGGDQVAQSASSALYWLQLARMETGETWTFPFFGTGGLSTSNVVEGARSLHVTNNSGTLGQALFSFSSTDFTADGRFGSGDFIRVTVTLDRVPLHIKVVLKDSLPQTLSAQWNSSALAVGTNHLYMKRSSLTGLGDLTDIVGFYLEVFDGGAVQTHAYFDNLQIIKADPDDPDVPNATGGRWRFTDTDTDYEPGVWTVQQDMPGFPYALAQLKSDNSMQYSAMLTGDYTLSDHMAAAVLLREDGAAGILFCAGDALNGYLLKLNTADDTVKLIERSGGVDTVLATAAYPSAPNTVYRLGLRRLSDGTLQGFVRSTPGDVYEAVNLKVSYLDSNFTHTRGKVGLLTYGSNVRFASVRAGSPEHALSAENSENAYALDALRGADYLAAMLLGS